MLSLRLVRWNRWFITILALYTVTTALTGGFYSPPGEPLWHRALFPLGISFLATAFWAAPDDPRIASSSARTRLFWALLTISILLTLARIAL